LSVSKKNTQDLIRINESLEKYYLNNSFKNFFSNKIFFQNSDHSDMNRWLKRGWGLSEPIRLIKLSKSSEENLPILFRFRYNEKNNTVLSKNTNNIYLAFKQKRYALRKNFQLKKNLKN